MREADKLVISNRPGESVGQFIQRWEDVALGKHGRGYLTNVHFEKCFKPFWKLRYRGKDWVAFHNALKNQFARDQYTWFGHEFYFTTEDQLILARIMIV